MNFDFISFFSEEKCSLDDMAIQGAKSRTKRWLINEQGFGIVHVLAQQLFLASPYRPAPKKPAVCPAPHQSRERRAGTPSCLPLDVRHVPRGESESDGAGVGDGREGGDAVVGHHRVS
jgi:hypothetical protein